MYYWINDPADQPDLVAYSDALHEIFLSLTSRARSGKSLQEFSFEICDLQGDHIDDIDEKFGLYLLRMLHVILISQLDLRILTISRRPFSEKLMQQLWNLIAQHCPHLADISIDDFEIYPNEKSERDPTGMLSMIGKLKSLDSLQLDGYILWTSQTLNCLANEITKNCKQIKYIRCGWVTIESKSDWEILMSVFKHNFNMRAIFFYAHHVTADVFDDDAKDIICEAAIQNLRKFNDYIVPVKKILTAHLNGQEFLIPNVFEYLRDDEIDDELTIAMSIQYNMIAEVQDAILAAASSIEKHVNQQIHSV
eukprot:CAMPEP_0202693472 /NCGR_PEP_ID=MMETSP1385-20130828/7584_1 /ASSEMBLY_ACC=CAM_ASM_000861 /TAXON_ID=933848 /ORGANISM="Elphidium margaritaceum" /LENGTH=307 /DNA_ID=CAMNT_0049349153 /DNA_START=724 /DNA_END=1643 /DNA_ORIENTATION=+